MCTHALGLLLSVVRVVSAGACRSADSDGIAWFLWHGVVAHVSVREYTASFANNGSQSCVAKAEFDACAVRRDAYGCHGVCCGCGCEEEERVCGN
jgi:hypothetical protein